MLSENRHCEVGVWAVGFLTERPGFGSWLSPSYALWLWVTQPWFSMSLPWECKIGLPVPSQPGSQEVKYMKSWWWAGLAADLNPHISGTLMTLMVWWAILRWVSRPKLCHPARSGPPAGFPSTETASFLFGTFLSSWWATVLSWLLYRMAFLTYMQKSLGGVPLAFERAESQVGNPPGPSEAV